MTSASFWCFLAQRKAGAQSADERLSWLLSHCGRSIALWGGGGGVGLWGEREGVKGQEGREGRGGWTAL